MAFVTNNIFLFAIVALSGGMLLWQTLAGRAAAGTSLDPLGATRLINDQNPIVIDVRSQAEFDSGHLIHSRNIPLDEFEQKIADLSDKRPILVCCATGARSARAVAKLRSAGREQSFNLAGGVSAWTGAGLPTVK